MELQCWRLASVCWRFGLSYQLQGLVERQADQATLTVVLWPSHLEVLDALLASLAHACHLHARWELEDLSRKNDCSVWEKFLDQGEQQHPDLFGSQKKLLPGTFRASFLIFSSMVDSHPV